MAALMQTGRLHPVIMAGGSGTRFWPLSRKAKPKQFLPLTSTRPLIAETARRLLPLAKAKDVWVVCGKSHAPSVRKLVPSLLPSHVLAEPIARNTAPAIALATAHVAKEDPQGILAVLPSDHHIADVPGFLKVLAEARDVAWQGSIVTIGIKPSRADTGYGYIRAGARMSTAARRVEAFVEKPNEERAREYLASGEYYWNGGIFVFRADVMLEAFRTHVPELSSGLDTLRAAIGKKSYSKTLEKVFPKMPSISIDYAVAEKATNIAVVPGEFGWSDVGSFNALADVREVDANGNVVVGKGPIVIDCKDCVVVGGDRPLAVVGLTGVVAVDAGDALLVLPKDKSQRVRDVVEGLQARKATAYL